MWKILFPILLIILTFFELGECIPRKGVCMQVIVGKGKAFPGALLNFIPNKHIGCEGKAWH